MSDLYLFHFLQIERYISQGINQDALIRELLAPESY